MKNILIISYFFPPCIRSGSQRVIKMALNLPKFSWNPIVLTASRPRCDRLDEDSLTEVKNVRVSRTKELLPFRNKKNILAKIFLRIWRFISLIDDHIGWIPFAYAKALKIVASTRIDLIFITGYPFSSFYIGYLLKKKTGIPYVLDYRDPWLSNPAFTKNRSKWILRRFEKKCLKYCSLYFGATPLIVEDTVKRYAEDDQCLSQKGKTFTYCFDRREFHDVEKNDLEIKDSEVIQLLCAGSIYDHTLFDRLISAFRHLQSKGVISDQNLKFIFYGKLREKYQIPQSLSNIMQLSPFVPRQVFLDKLNQCDSFILPHGSEPIVTMCFPGRMFELLAVQKPILYLGPRGIAAETIEGLGIGIYADSSSTTHIEKQISTFIFRIKNNDFKFDSRKVAKFEINQVMKGLADYLQEIHHQ